IRENAKGVVAIIIVIFIGIPFALTGIQNYLDVGPQTGIASVNGEEISRNEFARAYQQQRFRMEQMLGKNYDPKLFNDTEVKKSVLDQLINNKLATQDAKDNHYRVGVMQIASAIQTQRAFQSGGKFDKTMYEITLRNEGLTPSSFEYLVHQDMLINQHRSGIAETQGVTEYDIENTLKLINQKRDIGYVVAMKKSDINTNPSNEDIEYYYNKNGAEFMQEEQVKAEYVQLQLSELAKGVEVTEEELKHYYDSNEAAFVTKGERKIAHILITPEGQDDKTVENARSKAEYLYKEIKNGKDFANIAKSNSMDKDSAEKGGDLGKFEKGLMGDVFESAVMALKEGEVSEPVRTEFGFHIIKLTGLTPDVVKTFDQARTQITEEVKKEKASDRFYALAEKLEDLSYENQNSLEVPANELGLKIQETDFFSVGKGQGIAANPKFGNKAFEEEVLIQRINSQPVEVTPGNLVILRVKEHKSSEIKPMEAVKPLIIEKLKSQIASKNAQILADKFMQRLKAGEDGKQIADELKVEWKFKQAVTRNETALNPAVVRKAFGVGRPEGAPLIDSVELGNGDYAVIMVSKVTDGDSTSVKEAEKMNLARTLSNSRGTDEYQAYLKELRKDAKVIIRETEL
ncbi:MAG: SurA N-terminal domain-containing protein, partial [Gammaproteobacteria bacterium]|nr:SurA N-terminal domain-containing protein [Gammaproteobacteria bacterium]